MTRQISTHQATQAIVTKIVELSSHSAPSWDALNKSAHDLCSLTVKCNHFGPVSTSPDGFRCGKCNRRLKDIAAS